MKKMLSILVLFLFIFSSCEKEYPFTPTEVEQPTVIKGVHNLSITDSNEIFFVVYLNGSVIKINQTNPCKHKGQFYDLNFDELDYVILNQ
jgi:hypothetical protein